MNRKYLSLNNVQAYKKSFHLSNKIWNIVREFDYFAQNSIGIQFVRAIDSISANVAEGFGRYHKNDKIKFYRYAFGSLKEALDWNEKAKVRKLMTTEQYDHILNELQNLAREIHSLIKFTRERMEK